MASIEKTDAGTWLVRWRDPDGQQGKKTFRRKVDADDHLTHVEHSMLIGAYVDPTARSADFQGLAETWRAVQVHRPATVSTDRDHTCGATSTRSLAIGRSAPSDPARSRPS